MLNTMRVSRTLAAILIIAAATLGCSGMETTPLMPTYPAQIGGKYGVSLSDDSLCRQQAYAAADRARQSNVNKEIAYTAIGTLAGAVIGNQITVSSRSHGHYPSHYRGRHVPQHYSSHDLAGAGAITGAATGAALSQNGLYNTQQMYDITYNNCIQAYLNYR